jgi:hypothetical protein
VDHPSGDGCAAMTKHKGIEIERAIALLQRIACHDHQGAAQRVLRNPTPEAMQRLKSYADCLNAIANTDIQYWAREAIRCLEGSEDADD